MQTQNILCIPESLLTLIFHLRLRLCSALWQETVYPRALQAGQTLEKIFPKILMTVKKNITN